MKRVLILIVILLILNACAKKNTKIIPVVEIENEILTLKDLHNLYGEDGWNELNYDKQTEIINQWINLTLLANYAKNSNYLNDDSPLKIQIDNANKKILSNALIANELSNIEISDEELFNYYKINQSEFVRPAKEFKIQRIFFHQKTEMDIVKSIIDNNEMTYTAAAQKYSAEGIGRNGGYVSNLVTKTGQDSLLWKELNKINKFDILTMPYKTGYIIVRYYDYRENMENLNFYEIKDEIAYMLKQSKMNEVYNNLLEEARIKAKIKINL